MQKLLTKYSPYIKYAGILLITQLVGCLVFGALFEFGLVLSSLFNFGLSTFVLSKYKSV